MQHDPGMDDFADRDRDHRDRGDRDRENCNVREQDRFMPIANVIRIMRKVLPMHAKISDDGKETIQECVSEFISFVTSEANDRCQREQRKTITAEDLLWAMSKLGFDDYIDPLTFYLHRYREVEGDHRGSVRGDSLPKKEMNLHGLQPMMVQPNMFGGLSYYKDESSAPFTHDSYTVHK
uniref:CCAAT-box binding factor HAP3-like protein n=1 Tax=Isoetes sinensis TaxID=283158 RepID=A0A2H4DL77_9TRAC|nr:CCAAT-box binding factor HAP3-like protein [Isoetes sinensis]AMR93318.1 CCAAT-box binding factor HAP3-like protein [Isoetes sinensis]